MAVSQPVSEYRRAIVVTTPAAGQVEAAMEDDFHHFRVTLDHRDDRVTAIAVEAVRHPWSLCPAAAALLQGLVGTELTPALGVVLGRLPIRAQCTHMYDLACLAVAHAAKRTAMRRWDMAVDRPAQAVRRATLSLDGARALGWHIVDAHITDPYAVTLKGDFVGWASAHLKPDEAEAAILLRRAVFVAGGRRGDLDDRATAADGARNLGGCFVMQPGVADRATRMLGASRRFDAALPLALD